MLKTVTPPSTANLWDNTKNDKSKSSNGQMESKSAPKATNSNEDISACLNSANFDINPSLTKWDESSSEDESKSNPKHDQKKYSKKSKTTEFAYLLERKAFRMMRKYYKEKFEFEVDIAEYKKSLPLMTSEEFNEHVCKFIEREFGIITKLLSEKDYERTMKALKIIIWCDRYNKKEKITEGLDFELFRKVLHKYNTRNLNEFLSDASNSFLYTHFFLMNGKKSSEEQDDVKKDKFIQSMRHLMKEASSFLPSDINSIFEEIYNSINN